LEGELVLGGRWLRLVGHGRNVYVAQAADGAYYTWCDDSDERAVETYADPVMAISAGLRRAARREMEGPSRD